MQVSGVEGRDFYDTQIFILFAFWSQLTAYEKLDSQSNIEKLVILPVYLIAIGIFSIILENFLMIHEKWEEFKQDYNESEQLEFFLNILESKNYLEPLNQDLRSSIENYFDYRWQHDKNIFRATDQDHLIFT